MNNRDSGPHIALFMSELDGGGVQSCMRNLAGALAAMGVHVDLLVGNANSSAPGALVPPDVRLITLASAPAGRGRACALRADPHAAGLLLRPILFPIKGSGKLRYLPALADYLKDERPQALLSAMTYCNLVAVWARQLAGSSTQIVLSEHNVISNFVNSFPHQWRWRHLPPLIRHVYGAADAIVAVSDAAAGDLATLTHLPRRSITYVPNPVVDQRLRDLARVPLTHPWFKEGEPPVVLGVGRLKRPQKDPATLLRAFAVVRSGRPARLLLLGDGPERATLEQLAIELGVAADVAMPGWVDNPYPYMTQAGVTVLSSLWEGLPGVLIESLACGCPTVATDCPGGSAEILDHGKYGRLVPTRDAPTMAEAISASLDETRNSAYLQSRAEDFSVQHSAQRYAELLLSEHRPAKSTG